MNGKNNFIFAGLLVWALLISVGISSMMNYSNIPGASGKVRSHWPEDSSLKFSSAKPTIVMFAHPRCSCSNASMEELFGLLSRHEGKVEALAVFYSPGLVDEGWHKTALWKKASTFPGLKIFTDNKAEEVKRFGAETSGHTVLYSTSGELLFSGGITSMRGHAGPSAGSLAISEYLNSEKINKNKTPVFGCEIIKSKNA